MFTSFYTTNQYRNVHSTLYANQQSLQLILRMSNNNRTHNINQIQNGKNKQ